MLCKHTLCAVCIVKVFDYIDFICNRQKQPKGKQLWEESLNSDGQPFLQYQQYEQLSLT